jgi:hypothetical protein
MVKWLSGPPHFGLSAQARSLSYSCTTRGPTWVAFHTHIWPSESIHRWGLEILSVVLRMLSC